MDKEERRKSSTKAPGSFSCHWVNVLSFFPPYQRSNSLISSEKFVLEVSRNFVQQDTAVLKYFLNVRGDICK